MKLPRLRLSRWVRFEAALAALIVAFCDLHGQELRGRLSSTFYGFERAPGYEATSQHIRYYQTLDLSATKIAGRNLSLHLYGLANTDLRGNTVDDPRFWLYSAYLRYDFPMGEVRLGRQRIFAGVGFGTLDGVFTRFGLLEKTELEAFAGLQMPLVHGVKLDSWNESHMLGGRLRSTGWQRTRLAVSFVQKSRARKVYLLPGEYTAHRWLLEKISALQQRRVGIDLWQQTGRAEWSGRLDYDLLLNRLQRAEGNIRTRFGKLEVGGDYIFRNPLVDGNSIFSVFSQKSSQEMAARLLYAFSREVGLFGRVAYLAFEEESSLRFAVGIRARGGTLGVAHQSGYGGDRWGLTGDYHWRLDRRLWLHVSSNYSTYQEYGLDGEWEHTLAEILGLTWLPARGLRVDMELQGLQNRHVDVDVRALLRVTYGFRTRIAG